MTPEEQERLVAAIADELERRGNVDSSILLEVIRAREQLRYAERVLGRVEDVILAQARADER